MFWIEAEQEKCISGKIVLLFKKYLLICMGSELWEAESLVAAFGL